MNQFNRNLFTAKPSRLEVALDYLMATVIAVSLTMAALAYFDILA